MNFYHNRFLIDYCQHVTYNLLYRTDGATFFGEGEKYFSLIDDTEIEIMKCIWETPETYERIPPPRRLWNVEFPELGIKTINKSGKSYYAPDHSYSELFIKLTNNTIEAANKIEEHKDISNTLVFNRLERGVLFLMLIQIKNWEKIYFLEGLTKAIDSLKTYLARFQNYNHYIQKIEFLDPQQIDSIQKPYIMIFNEDCKQRNEMIFNEDKNIGLTIHYNGRI
jgi:hypothetical protein